MDTYNTEHQRNGWNDANESYVIKDEKEQYAKGRIEKFYTTC